MKQKNKKKALAPQNLIIPIPESLADALAKISVDWQKLEQQVYSLRHLPIPPEEKLRRAAQLAAIYRAHNRPLPDELAILV